MKKKRLIIAVVLICCVILYIWQTNKIHNTPKMNTAVSTESNTTTQQAETTTQLTTQTSTETTMEPDTEEYFEEDTEEEAQLKKTIAELMKEESNTTSQGEKAVQCYIQFLKDNPESKYDIADIDGDGTPEFFTLSEGWDAAMYRYNAKKDKVMEPDFLDESPVFLHLAADFFRELVRQTVEAVQITRGAVHNQIGRASCRERV